MRFHLMPFALPRPPCGRTLAAVSHSFDQAYMLQKTIGRNCTDLSTGIVTRLGCDPLAAIAPGGVRPSLNLRPLSLARLPGGSPTVTGCCGQGATSLDAAHGVSPMFEYHQLMAPSPSRISKAGREVNGQSTVSNLGCPTRRGHIL